MSTKTTDRLTMLALTLNIVLAAFAHNWHALISWATACMFFLAYLVARERADRR